MGVKTKLFGAILIVLIAAGILYYLGYLDEYIDRETLEKYYDTYVNGKKASDKIADFESCAKAGGAIMESYPRQCKAPNGKTYTETLNETQTANPASIYCEENNGTIEMVSGPEGVAGICVFSDGTRCDEWEYFRGECTKPEKIEALLKEPFSLKTRDSALIKPINLEVKLLNMTAEAETIKAHISVNSTEYDATYSPLKEDAGTEVADKYIIKLINTTGDKAGIFIIMKKAKKKIDNSCTTNSDCAIKDVGSLCGRFPACVNKNYAPDPPEIESSICAYTEIDGCICQNNQCVGTIAGEVNEY